MKIRMLLSMLAITATMLLTGCGDPVPQNKIAIVTRTLGDRSVNNQMASSELYYARRLPWQTPGIRIFVFHLGLQDFSFSQRASYESPNPDQIEVDCVGGHLAFDVNVQLYIDRNADKLGERLLAFINDHQLQSYNGEHNMLSLWGNQKLKQFIRQPLAQYALNRQAIDIMRQKKEMNALLLKSMNDRFNKYGIIFSAAGITSQIVLPPDQKQKMETIVKQEYANLALDKREREFMPLTNSLNTIEQDGMTRCQDAKNFGVQEAIRIEADALKERRDMFTALVGQDNYVTLEQIVTTSRSLESGNTKLTIVPASLSYMHLSAGQEQPAAKHEAKQ